MFTYISEALESSQSEFVQTSLYKEVPLVSAFRVYVPFAACHGSENLIQPSIGCMMLHPTAPVVCQVNVSDSFGSGFIFETLNELITALAGDTTVNVSVYSIVFHEPPIVPLQSTLKNVSVTSFGKSIFITSLSVLFHEVFHTQFSVLKLISRYFVFGLSYVYFA